eukprot:TRINITY_DN6156_c0_g3_i1.p1 TRINITY_DN6156_c0_g3~~TRINITY_DN6156_c0_g3_i1.p1  ORF type:complete len:440 (+),score=134.84 TRINITY_DN6156_c0_g3_i1:34-1353(+)
MCRGDRARSPVMSDGGEDWDWETCDSPDEAISQVSRASRPTRRGGGQVAAKMERAVAKIEQTVEALGRLEMECKLWRQATAALCVTQLLTLVPAAVKEYVAALFSRLGGWLLDVVAKHGPRTAVLLVLGHLLVACVTKMLRQRGLLAPAMAEGAAEGSPRTTGVTLVLPPPAPTDASLRPAQVREQAGEPAAAAAAADADTDSPLSPQVRKLLNFATKTAWQPVASEKGRAWSTAAVDWNGGHKVTRFTADLKCSAKHFVHQVVELAPKAQRESDPMMENYRVLDESKEGKYGGYRRVYVSFKTPVWGIGQRDICVKAERTFLTPEEAHAYGEIAAPSDQPEVADRFEMEMDKVTNTFVIAFQSSTHPDAPEYKQYVRAHSNVNGYILTPTGEHTCRVTECIALDIKGSLPAWAVEAAAKRIYERFHKFADYLEKSYPR